MTTAHDTIDVSYDELCGLLLARDLKPLWKETRRLNTPQPVPRTQAWLWAWRTVLPLAEKAGELVAIDRGGDRRVLALTNPGLGGRPFTSSTLWGAIQYLGPGESAPAHRHSASAIRFVMHGQGAHTTVDGDACDMRPGDLLVTPNWAWHDHTNTGDSPMAWFDGLDLPLVVALDAVFFEPCPELMQPVEGRNRAEALYGGTGLLPPSAGETTPFSPLHRYPWDTADQALTAATAQTEEPIVSLEYTNPVTGGPAFPTLGCEIHRLMPRGRTTTTRQVGNSVYIVFRGRGTTVIDGQRFDWRQGDVFVTPSWAAVDHEAAEPSDLFVITDRPVLEQLHLFRRQQEDHQDITSVFTPR